jgi:integrase
LEDRTNRLKLPPAKKPVFVKIGPRVGLGYRRNRTAGTWVVRAADGKGGNWTKAIGIADDFEDANGSTILTFWEAQDRARSVAHAGQGDEGNDGKLLTVAAALDRYQADLGTRGGDVGNVARVRVHLTDNLVRRPVALLTSRELRRWRDGLAKHMAPASVNRAATALKAALNLAADGHEGVANRTAWGIGLKALPDATETRNVILDEAQVRRVVAEAYRESAEFGLLVEIAAVTGARYSQLARLQKRDVKSDHLSIPTSRKGRGEKKIKRRQVPLPSALVARLQAIAADKADAALLLNKPDGGPWKKSDQLRPWRKAAERAGLDPNEVSMYALRHTSITRMLKAGVPIRIVAALHDTSVGQIERTYALKIDKHVDDIVRPAMLDLTPARGQRRTSAEVVAIRG